MHVFDCRIKTVGTGRYASSPAAEHFWISRHYQDITDAVVVVVYGSIVPFCRNIFFEVHRKIIFLAFQRGIGGLNVCSILCIKMQACATASDNKAAGVYHGSNVNVGGSVYISHTMI